MRAVVCTEIGELDNLSLQEIDDLSVESGQVQIEVKAAGINFPDLLTVQGKYQFMPDVPFIPGVELAGVVSKVGDNAPRFSVGDKVIATPPIGAFAEHCVVDEAAVISMSNSMSFEQGAGFALTYGTSYYALKQRANLQPSETLLVLGAAGGVGLAAVQLGKQMGATVIAAASTEEKLDFACAAGADQRINYTTSDLKTKIKDLTDGKGADVIYDPVGGDYSEQAFRSIAWCGRFLVVGFAAGDIPKMPLNLALLKGASLVGVFWGSWAKSFPKESQQNYQEIVAMIDEGKLSLPMSEVYPLVEFSDALKCLSERRAKGKVVLSMT